MANELTLSYPSGVTLYAVLLNAVGQIYNTVGAAFEAPAAANWTDYDIAMAEAETTGIYRGTMPAVAAGRYSYYVRLRAGGAPATTDLTVGTGTIEWSGTVEVTQATIVDAVWDEILTGATHNIPTSAGRRLRTQGAVSIIDGVCQGGASQTITLAADATLVDTIYNDNLIVLTAGTGAGQTGFVLESRVIGGQMVLIVDKPWIVVPISGDTEYQLIGFSGVLLAHHGVAQAGGSDWIKLAATALADTNSYRGSAIYLASGTGAGQTRLITASAWDATAPAALKCTVSPPWETGRIPDTTTAYKVIPVGRSIVESISDDAISADALAASAIAKIAAGVWDALTSGLTAVGSIGKLLVEKLALIGSGGVTVVAPVAENGNVVTYRGDSYRNADGRALDWESDDWPDLTGATVTVIVGKVAQFAGSVVSPAGPGIVRLELTTAQSATIPVGRHKFQVVATIGSQAFTLVAASWVSYLRETV